MGYLMKLILFRRCRSEKFDSDGVDGNKIGATLVECVARGRFCQSLDQRTVARGWSDEDFSGRFV